MQPDQTVQAAEQFEADHALMFQHLIGSSECSGNRSIPSSG
ncbi:hypothetical protein SynRCC2555_00610 [Synechococcus sp. WH 8101]|nr:hypothetical protein SynRCC2555_00610 [Synechococcus sp. WH 8101]